MHFLLKLKYVLLYLQPARPLDLETIVGLGSNEWKARSEAIENLYELVRRNPDGVARHVSKVFALSIS